MEAVIVSIDGGTPFVALDSGESWNGWAVPLFTRAQAAHVLTSFAAQDGGLSRMQYAETALGGEFTYWNTEGQDERWTPSTSVQTRHITEPLWAIGGWSWVWDIEFDADAMRMLQAELQGRSS